MFERRSRAPTLPLQSEQPRAPFISCSVADVHFRVRCRRSLLVFVTEPCRCSLSFSVAGVRCRPSFRARLLEFVAGVRCRAICLGTLCGSTGGHETSRHEQGGATFTGQMQNAAKVVRLDRPGEHGFHAPVRQSRVRCAAGRSTRAPPPDCARGSAAEDSPHPKRRPPPTASHDLARGTPCTHRGALLQRRTNIVRHLARTPPVPPLQGCAWCAFAS